MMISLVVPFFFSLLSVIAFGSEASEEEGGSRDKIDRICLENNQNGYLKSNILVFV